MYVRDLAEPASGSSYEPRIQDREKKTGLRARGPAATGRKVGGKEVWTIDFREGECGGGKLKNCMKTLGKLQKPKAGAKEKKK